MANEVFKCSVCGKEYSRLPYAKACEQSHDIVYIPITRSDLFRLIQFLYTKDEQLLTESLVRTLQKYNTKLTQ